MNTSKCVYCGKNIFGYGVEHQLKSGITIKTPYCSRKCLIDDPESEKVLLYSSINHVKEDIERKEEEQIYKLKQRNKFDQEKLDKINWLKTNYNIKNDLEVEKIVNSYLNSKSWDQKKWIFDFEIKKMRNRLLNKNIINNETGIGYPIGYEKYYGRKKRILQFILITSIIVTFVSYKFNNPLIISGWLTFISIIISFYYLYTLLFPSFEKTD